MPTLSDSTAIRDGDRLLPQHQAALTLLQDRLSGPIAGRFAWLDLACGRGQIILSLDSHLSSEARSRIDFCAYDLDQAYARDTEKTAARLGFASLQVRVGDLIDFDRILPSGQLFNFITLTNVVHEISPVALASVLVSCVTRLEGAGTLFVYDMERLLPPELGAVAWTRDEMLRIIRRMLDALGVSDYRPEIGRWTHRTCSAWNVHLQRCHLGISRTCAEQSRDDAVIATRDEIYELLTRKFSECRHALELLTRYGGGETNEEQDSTKRLLYEFWSLSRALESKP